MLEVDTDIEVREKMHGGLVLPKLRSGSGVGHQWGVNRAFCVSAPQLERITMLQHLQGSKPT
jgi:hypothetical protein